MLKTTLLASPRLHLRRKNDRITQGTHRTRIESCPKRRRTQTGKGSNSPTHQKTLRGCARSVRLFSSAAHAPTKGVGLPLLLAGMDDIDDREGEMGVMWL